jgi:hypothetical protein
MMGPQTYNNIGSEIYPTANRILKGTGIEHVGDSCIFDDGTTVTINANLKGCGGVYFSGNVGIGTENAVANLTLKENESCKALVIYGRTSDNLARIDFFRADETCFAGRIQMDNGTNSNMSIRAQGNIRLQTGGSTDRLTIANTGEAIFSCQICAPSFVGGTFNGTTGNFNGILTVSANSSANAIAINGRSSDNTGTIDFFQNNGTTRVMEIGVSPTAAEFYYDTNAPMIFYTNQLERLRITGTGATVIRPNCIGLSDVADRTLLLGSRPGNSDIVSFGFDSGGTWKGGFDYKGSDGQLEWWTNNGSWCRRILYGPTGTACFAGALTAATIGTNDLILNNLNYECANYVDGTRGSWLIQEGENDLFIINQVSCKKYKFNLIEIK